LPGEAVSNFDRLKIVSEYSPADYDGGVAGFFFKNKSKLFKAAGRSIRLDPLKYYKVFSTTSVSGPKKARRPRVRKPVEKPEKPQKFL
jgi:hypothetical protein